MVPKELIFEAMYHPVFTTAPMIAAPPIMAGTIVPRGSFPIITCRGVRTSDIIICLAQDRNRYNNAFQDNINFMAFTIKMGN